MASSGGGLSLNNNINVTPLVDVMLVLLIIFMLITPMLQPGVDVKVPKAEHSTEHPDKDETLVLALRGDRSLFLNQDEIAEEDLLPALTSIMGERSEKILFIKANELLEFGWVQEKMDVCRRAGAVEIALITRKKPDASLVPFRAVDHEKALVSIAVAVDECGMRSTA